MNQLLLPHHYSGGATVSVTGRDHHYLKRVLRLKPGDTLTGRDHGGAVYRLTVEREGEGEFVLRSEMQADSGQTAQSAFGHVLNLFQCLPKGARMDEIVRRATELGVMRIVPLLSELTVSRPPDRERAAKSAARWRRIAKEALQQSGATRPPVITEPTPLSAIESREDGCDLFFHVDREMGVSLHGMLAEAPRTVNVLVGPEGGFSKREITFILDSGFSPVCLGDTVLRVETAAVAVISAVKTLLWERTDWTTV